MAFYLGRDWEWGPMGRLHYAMEAYRWGYGVGLPAVTVGIAAATQRGQKRKFDETQLPEITGTGPLLIAGTSRENQPMEEDATPRYSFGGGGRPTARYSGAGVYGGKLMRPRKPKKTTVYQSRGVHREFEIHGKVSLKDCAYLTVASYSAKELVTDIAMGLMRYMMKKHYGISYRSENEFVVPQVYRRPGSATVNAGAFPVQDVVFVLHERTTAGNTTETLVTYPFNSTDTLKQFGDWFHTNVWLDQIKKHPITASVGDLKQDLVAYYFNEQDATVQVSNGDLTPMLRITKYTPCGDLKMKVYSYRKVFIQNVTPADNTTLTDNLQMTRVDTNPLNGMVLRFDAPVPEFKNPTYAGGAGTVGGTLQGTTYEYNALLALNDHGVYLPNAHPTNDWKAIPDPKMFKKCSGVQPFKIMPGVIRDFDLKFNYYGNINVLMRGIAYQGGTWYEQDCFGTCAVLAAEKMIRTGASNVEFNYHVDSWHGCTIVGKSKVVFQKGGDIKADPHSTNPT